MIPYCIEQIEQLLLPSECHFADDAKAVIDCWDSTTVLACPGSGKTTVLMAKLKILADNMPLPNGRGVCVLSHTNVAVNEIKSRLGSDAEKIISHPNFVGTVQSFIDRFVAFPYIRNEIKGSLHLVDKSDYADHLIRVIEKKHLYALKVTIAANWEKLQSRFLTVNKFVETLYLENNGDLRSFAITSRALAKADKPSAKQFRQAIKCLRDDGIIRYEDSYQFTNDALDKYGDDLKAVLSARFAFVLIDEYQDCSELQRATIDRLFAGTDTVLQKIGDTDQAIYVVSKEAIPEHEWSISGNVLEISKANRYGNEIADILTLLREKQNRITTSIGNRKILPTIIVYTSETKEKVIDSFIEAIIDAGLPPEGTYKAIGMFKNVNGLKIGDYWKEFNVNTSKGELWSWASFLSQLSVALEHGNIGAVDRIIHNLLYNVFRRQNYRQADGKPYSRTVIKEYTNKTLRDVYSTWLFSLVSQAKYDLQTLDTSVRGLFEMLFPKCDILNDLSDEFMSTLDIAPLTNSNEYIGKNKYKVFFDTVHGVKGETHDATLYLETEYKKNTDLKRIMPLLCGGQIPKSEIYTRSRRCAYVGFSRPRYLLCVAIKKETYVGNESTFETWKKVFLE